MSRETFPLLYLQARKLKIKVSDVSSGKYFISVYLINLSRALGLYLLLLLLLLLLFMLLIALMADITMLLDIPMKVRKSRTPP